MSVKPDTPITRKEMYLDVATGGSSSLPEPETIEEKYLAKIAGMAVDLPAPVPLKHKFLAKIAGMQVDVPTYTTGLPRIYAYLAKAAGQDVEVPQPITREEMYWFDYVSTPSEKEYTGAVPVIFTANGQSLLDYLISGNTVQSGTPTPDSPVMPQGTGERTGNLFDEVYPNISGTIRYIPLYVGEGSFTLSTTVPYDSSVANLFLLSGNVSTGASTAENGAWKKHNVTTQSVDGYVSIAYRRYTGTTSPAECETMLNSGSTPLPYEPYGYKIPISSANTTTPIYLGEVQTTRKIKKLVLTGQETRWYKSGAYQGSFCLGSVSPEPISLTEQAYCSHAEFTSISTYAKNKFCFNGSPINLNLWIGESSWTTDDFKAYLAQQYAAGTPVTIWYVLVTEETGIVNEPLMKIGDYADTLSKEQAGVNVPTVAGSNTLDVLTPIKPSEVYIKYIGEPVSQMSMLSSRNTDEPEEPSEELSEEAEEIPEEETSEEFSEDKEEKTESITPETTKE